MRHIGDEWKEGKKMKRMEFNKVTFIAEGNSKKFVLVYEKTKITKKLRKIFFYGRQLMEIFLLH